MVHFLGNLIQISPQTKTQQGHMQMRRGQRPVRNVQRATDVRLHTSVLSSVPGGHTALQGQRHALPV